MNQPPCNAQQFPSITEWLLMTLFESLQSSQASKQLIVAYSGGADSHVLLHALVQLRQQKLLENLSAIHINHGLQSLSDDWQQHCQNVCTQLNIPLTVVELNLSQNQQMPVRNLESTARQARYQAFIEYLADGDCLLMAHHIDDQAETLLFRLLRGCGVAGASAMPQSRKLGKGQLLRPLLNCSRQQIEEYARLNQLQWIEDPSNASLDFSRNYIRHQVMPKLQQKWPGVATNFARFSQIAGQQSALLDEIATADLEVVSPSKNCLNLSELKSLSANRLTNLLHFWGRKFALNAPSQREVVELARQIASTKETSIHLDFAGMSVRQFRGQLMLVSKLFPSDQFAKQAWTNLSTALLLSNGVRLTLQQHQQAGLRAPNEDEKLWVVCRQGGERCHPSYRQHSTSLKKIYQELDVPPWQRSWLPIIYYNEQIAAVPGVFIGKAFQTDENQLSISFTLETS